MKAKIKNKEKIAKGSLLVEFDLLGKEVSFKPGQYFFLTLLNPLYTDSKGNERHFSIINSPNEKGVLTMATRIRESSFKQNLSEMSIGAEVEIGQIGGSFSLPDEGSSVVFIAGGIGIAPFMSMLRYINEENLDYKITLLYANRGRESTAFLKELSSFAKASADKGRFKMIMIMSDDPNWGGEKGKIDTQFIKDNISEPKSHHYLIAGAPLMVEAMYNILSEIGVDGGKIETDNFSGY